MSPLFYKPFIRFLGETGLLVEYGDAIAPEINRKVRAMSIALDQDPPRGIVEVIPTYRSLLISYEPGVTTPQRLVDDLEALEDRLGSIEIPDPALVEIPVCYGGELGPDLDFVCEHTGLSQEEVIARHIRPSYQIYMIGFTPGFPFLGGMDESLTTPRLPNPRTLVPAGSVGIANNQTGMYSIGSPGGWRLIGRTPFTLFDHKREEPFLYRAGDLIKFKPIFLAEYQAMSAAGGR